MPEKCIRVLIVDDSAVVRGALKKMLSRDETIEVIGTAIDPYQAREKIVRLRPDVVTLDIEMPKMDGMTFLEKLMTNAPVPVVMCSSLTRERADLAVRAIELGAVEVVNKPCSTQKEGLQELSIELIDKIKAAAKVRVRQTGRPSSGARCRPASPSGSSVGRIRGVGYAKAKVLSAPSTLRKQQHKIIAIGASTGGTEALRVVLEQLPRDTPPVLVVQHMPEHFTFSFAKRLNSMCTIDVKEAEAGDQLRPGLALIAQGNSHLTLKQVGEQMVAGVRSGPLVCRHRPSVEVLFNSVAEVAGPSAIGVILTGMGGDGAAGMLALKESGARTIAQDEASSIVFGMPKEAIRMGGVERVEHLERIARAILDSCCASQRNALQRI